MPPLTKKQKQARGQQASRETVFTIGLVEDLSNQTTDLNYQPDSKCEVTDSDSVVCVGEKRKVRTDSKASDHISVCLYLLFKEISLSCSPFIRQKRNHLSVQCLYTLEQEEHPHICENEIYTMLQRAAKRSYHSLLQLPKSRNLCQSQLWPPLTLQWPSPKPMMTTMIAMVMVMTTTMTVMMTVTTMVMVTMAAATMKTTTKRWCGQWQICLCK